MVPFSLRWELAFSCSRLSGLCHFNVSFEIREYGVIWKLTLVIGVENPKLIFIMGCVGFGLNILSVLFLHGM